MSLFEGSTRGHGRWAAGNRRREDDRREAATATVRHRTSHWWTQWRFAAIEAEISFDQWCDAPESQKGVAFAIHRDALVREAHAAELLAAAYAAREAVTSYEA
jgi:hypothetical protein